LKHHFLLIFCLLSFCSCKKAVHNIITPPPGDSTLNTPFFAKGADVSWLTEMETSGIQFYNTAGNPQDCMAILKSLGMNAIRLRAWVNAAGTYNNTADVVAKAIRAKNAGMKIMIDFHYSDTWADPGHQQKPAAWSGQDIIALQASVRDYTAGVLNTLKANGVFADWVQVGNETNDGMLWPEGQASVNMANFALLVNAGYNAVKSVSDNSKVIVHISNAYDNVLYRWIFDGLKNNGAQWDIIGMSLYPSASNWATLNSQSLANMNDMVARYNKPVMICEVGMSWTDSTACNSFINDIITKTRSVTRGKGLGVFYWEPESHNNWQGYTLGAFDNSGRPTMALQAFK
jgi:arabinogalactan endo-1,4-beta-galactosidase